MSNEIRIVYASAEAMIATFTKSAEQVRETMQDMQHIAGVMEDGALLGRGGQAFSESLRGKLGPSLAKLADKFDELAKDVEAAVEAMREADSSSASMIG